MKNFKLPAITIISLTFAFLIGPTNVSAQLFRNCRPDPCCRPAYRPVVRDCCFARSYREYYAQPIYSPPIYFPPICCCQQSVVKAPCGSCTVKWDKIHEVYLIQSPCTGGKGCYCPVPKPYHHFACIDRDDGEKISKFQFFLGLSCNLIGADPESRPFFNADPTLTDDVVKFGVLKSDGSGDLYWKVIATYHDDGSSHAVVLPEAPEGTIIDYVVYKVPKTTSPIVIAFDKDSRDQTFVFGYWKVQIILTE